MVQHITLPQLRVVARFVEHETGNKRRFNMFQVIRGSPARMWYHVDCADRSTYETLYIGQLVTPGYDGAFCDAVMNLGQATGINATTYKKQPFGVVIGTNLRTPGFSTTSNSDYITAVDPHSSTTEFAGGEGPYAVRGDHSAMVEVALIDPCTVLKGDLRNAAIGTGPTVRTVSTASTTGAGFTVSAAFDFTTPVANLTTVYCRSGANMGIYRDTTDTSSTVVTTDQYFPYDIAVGDTFVRVPLRMVGNSYVQTDAEALYFNTAANPATNYWTIQVIHLDLSTANQEYVVFRFDGDHFCAVRA
jgi:hypothetical protein